MGRQGAACWTPEPGSIIPQGVNAHPTIVAPTREAPPAQRRPKPWAGWSTRRRLIVAVLAIDVIAALISCAVIVLNARNAVKVETRASLATVESLVADTVRLAQGASPEALLQTLDLRFQALRHVRVSVVDDDGDVIAAPSGRPRTERAAPAWFAELIAPPIQQHTLPLVVGGRTIGQARITTQPMDEIDEIWSYARALSITTFCINAAMLAALWLVLGRVLAPLGSLAEGLTQLERHDYTARLAPPDTRELAAIAARFNKVAEALGEVRAANGRLNRQLLTAQDDEGRRIALELHDEFGPCLFALEANAASIARIAAGEAEPDRTKLATRAADIAAIVGQVQGRNRDLLNRLRPHGLGQVPLADCLNLLLRDFARRHPATRFTGDFEGLARGYGDLIDLTVFRCVQESMTNAVRHGAASAVRAEVHERVGGLIIAVRDDGAGLEPGHGTGLGLSGMRERVGALEGSFALDNAAPGAVVRITIPVPDRAEDASTVAVP